MHRHRITRPSRYGSLCRFRRLRAPIRRSGFLRRSSRKRSHSNLSSIIAPAPRAISGAEAAARAAPDGYTLLVAPASLASSQSLYKKLPFDLVRDFEPIAMLASAPFVLAVHPSVPAKSVRELVALAKARPGQLNFASTGVGGTNHLSGELFKSKDNGRDPGQVANSQ